MKKYLIVLFGFAFLAFNLNAAEKFIVKIKPIEIQVENARQLDPSKNSVQIQCSKALAEALIKRGLAFDPNLKGRTDVENMAHEIMSRIEAYDSLLKSRSRDPLGSQTSLLDVLRDTMDTSFIIICVRLMSDFKIETLGQFLELMRDSDIDQFDVKIRGERWIRPNFGEKKKLKLAAFRDALLRYSQKNFPTDDIR